MWLEDDWIISISFLSQNYAGGHSYLDNTLTEQECLKLLFQNGKKIRLN